MDLENRPIGVKDDGGRGILVARQVPFRGDPLLIFHLLKTNGLPDAFDLEDCNGYMEFCRGLQEFCGNGQFAAWKQASAQNCSAKAAPWEHLFQCGGRLASGVPASGSTTSGWGWNRPIAAAEYREGIKIASLVAGSSARCKCLDSSETQNGEPKGSPLSCG